MNDNLTSLFPFFFKKKKKKKTNFSFWILFTKMFHLLYLFIDTFKNLTHLQKILQSGLFLTAPYSFYTNQTIEPLTHQYGLRICAFNNSEIQNPFAVDWTRGTGQSVSVKSVSNSDVSVM
ncbi:unnamed protein product [Brugia timori]|uniref:Uncharacterized protein n=1 Tax=Brugia timori TaxID=42155 RepID=A0A0R3QHN3_9BILA|nr:unnamed protein product [Brugia timori]